MKRYHSYRLFAFTVFMVCMTNTSIFADDYYWIGGNGNWSDINHWATQSGGNILHIQIPTSADNVFFDENSFSDTAQVITINSENAICRNLIWSDVQFNPTVTGEGYNNLRIYGSLILAENMNFQFAGTITFEGNQTGNTIQPKGHSLLNHIFIDGIGGEWSLADTLRINGNLYLNNGAFSTNGQYLSCLALYSSKTTARTLNISNSMIRIFGSWNVNGLMLDLLASNSLIQLDAELNSSDGDTLYYDRVIFADTGSLSSINVYSIFESAIFNSGGMASGSASIDTILFYGWMGNLNDRISTNYVWMQGDGSFYGENSVLEAIVQNSTKISDNNLIKDIRIGEKGLVEGNNTIQWITIGDTGIIRQDNEIGNLYFGSTGYVSGNNHIENARFTCDGFFYNDNTFDTLTFQPGFRYFLQEGSTTEINSIFNTTGTCQEPIFIKSGYNGSPAYLNQTSGSAYGEFLSLRDIHASGTSGNFVANNSVDLGNNEGWTIDTSPEKDLYWVGGQGEWRDTDHWSETSGGPGGACPPTELDNVFFDAASLATGDSVIVSSKIAVCHDMDWTGSAGQSIFYGPDTNYLKIYGSLTYSESMQNSFFGETHFEATEINKKISSAGKLLFNNVRLQGIGGEWILQDELDVFDTLYHDHGGFISNHNNIHTGKYYSYDTNIRKLDLFTDTLYVKDGGYAFRLRALNYELDADSSVIVMEKNQARMAIQGGDDLVFNNVHFRGVQSEMHNGNHIIYNLITFDAFSGMIVGSATIDTVIFYSDLGQIYDMDTIKTVIFHGNDNILSGTHVVEIAYYFGSGSAELENQIDTALFYSVGSIIGENIIDTTIIHEDAYIDGTNVIRTATLKDGGEFWGENTFNDLFLEFSKSYMFQHGVKQIIIDTLHAEGRCTGPIFFISDVQGEPAGIEMVNGTFQTDYANLRDMQAFGNELPFIATNSIDLGGNIDWDIYQGESKALYWVGDSGNWSDSLHWAAESGGEPGYCIPSPIDDVYFDHNSFSDSSKVTINVDIATCRNMSWNGAEYHPVFTGEFEQSLFIYGSLEMIEKMDMDVGGPVHFSSREMENYIISSGQSFKYDLIFDGVDGSWKIMDSLSVEHALTHRWGTFQTDGHPVSARLFLSPDTNQRVLDLDTSTIYIIASWNVRNENLLLDADSSLIISTGNVISTGKSTNEFLRYNDVIFNSGNSLINDTVYCFYDDVTFNMGGNVNGQCSIDTLFFAEEGYVAGTDSINYCYFTNFGVLDGGYHQVHTAIFAGGGSIDGSCHVDIALFYDHGNVAGGNELDTTIFYGSGSIQGENIFHSELLIFGDGTMLGSNHVYKNLTIHGVANIFETNQIHNALLLGWGYIGGYNVFGTLTFTPGNTYTLTASTQQTILDTFNIRGNNCFPITLLSSSINNVKASIYKESGEVSGDFIIMENIEAMGGAEFYAGGHSDNIINNTGWIWDNAPGYIYGLGEDIQLLCEGSTLVLSTENFNGNDNTIYEWFDGSTSPTYEVTEAGTYGLTVYYSDDCSVPGQITVEQIPSPTLNLGPDHEICEGNWFSLPQTGEYETYLWSDSTLTDSVVISQEGLYWLEVTNDHGCPARDSIIFSLLPAPVVDLGEDQILQNGEFIELDAGYPGGNFFWSTGSTSQTITAQGVEGGNIYWVDVWFGGCKGSDTLLVDEYPYCTAQVPTAFTPNEDGTNDTLFIYGSGISILQFQVYNRYGQMVFETTDIHKGWDGKTNGQKQENEVYLYYLKAVCFDGGLTERSGNITLIR